MEPRIDYSKAIAKEGMQTLYGLEHYVRKSGLEAKLLELVRMRASQLNGCAYCLDMHSKDARAEGETEQRLYGLSAWRETPYYTDRERAALEWTDPDGFRGCGFFQVRDGLIVHQRGYWDSAQLNEIHPDVHAE